MDRRDVRVGLADEGRHQLGRRMGDAILDDHAHGRGVLNPLERIALRDQDVGQRSLGQGPDRLFQIFAGIAGGGGERLIGRHAISDHPAQVHMQAHPVEIDRGVRAGHHLPAIAQGLAQMVDIAGQGGQRRAIVALGRQLGALGQSGVLPRRIERPGSRIVDQGAVLTVEGGGGEQGWRAPGPALDEQGGDILVAGAKRAGGAGVSEPAGRADVLHAVQAEGQGRIVVVRGDVETPRVGPGR
ncbi:hypothetical protein GALL_541150 [mine drainage metagenome]|uniref:Uncharacterized protein n=1 Tax=mine drainage metagenome TaxID=410659 RepID=A0A1J5NZR8_9ZZZZ